MSALRFRILIGSLPDAEKETPARGSPPILASANRLPSGETTAISSEFVRGISKRTSSDEEADRLADPLRTISGRV